MEHYNPDEIIKVNHRSVKRSRYLILITVICFIAYALMAMDTAMFGIAIPEMAKESYFNMGTLGVIASISFIPIVLGGLISGPIADRFGRKKTIQAVLLTVGVFCGLTAIVTKSWQLLVVRFLGGAGLAEGPLGNTLVSEEAPDRYRGRMVGITQAGYPVGAALAGLLGAIILPLYGWRALFLFAFIPIFLIIAMMRYMREPPSAARAISEKKVERTELEWKTLFRKQDRKQTLTLFLFCLFEFPSIPLVALFAVSFLTSDKGISIGEAALWFSVIQWAALGAQVATGFLSDKMPAKIIVVLWALIGGLGLLVTAVSDDPHIAMAGLLGYTLFGQGLWGCLPRYIADSYHADVRATAMTFFVAVGNSSFLWIPAVAGFMIEAQRGPLLFGLVGGGVAVAAVILGVSGRRIPVHGKLTTAGQTA